VNEKEREVSFDVAAVDSSENLRNLQGGWLQVLKWISRLWAFYQVIIAGGWIAPAI